MLNPHTHCRKRIFCNSLILLTLWVAVIWTLYGVRHSNLGGTAKYQKLQRLAWYGVVINSNQP